MLKTPYVIDAKDCRLGDIVRPVVLDNPNEGYSDSTVIKITDQSVTLFRPYVHTSDFTYTDGVIPYVGMNQYTVLPTTKVTVLSESRVTDVINTETDPDRLARSGVAERRRDGSDRPEYRKYWQTEEVAK